MTLGGEAACSDVQNGVKWYSLFCVRGKDVLFLSFLYFTKCGKVTFLVGARLTLLPPESSKREKERFLNVYEDRDFGAAEFSDWVKQVSWIDGIRAACS
ncbi:MAG: hypothetical protein AAGH83_11700 [Pseudomonadota bacterium]